jgi:hypothetical protein
MRGGRRIVLVLTAAIGLSCHKMAPNDDSDPRAPADRSARATATIAGTSISDVQGDGLAEALTTATWKPGGAILNVNGSMEVLNVTADQGPLHATISVVRPRRTPGATTTHSASAKEQETYFSSYAATLLDDPVLVAVAIKGHKDDAAKLLDTLVKR